MIRFFKNLFKGKDPGPVPEAPYKVEAPAAPEPARCGCGRSQNGLCVGLHKLTPEEWSTHADNPNKAPTAPAGKKPTAKKAPAKPKTEKKPAAIKAPRKPKAKQEAK
jgi:hypothetical protein